MPRMDGFEATSELRRLEGAARHTPVVALTAATEVESRAQCIEAGMDDYLSKPVDREQFALVLARWTAGAGAVATSLTKR